MESGWVGSSGMMMMMMMMMGFSLLCGFGPLCVIRRAAGSRPLVVSLASCLSGGVFLSCCLLELLPDYLNHSRETFSRLGLALHFPLAEFILAMGFLLVLVSEQMLLAVREHSGIPREKQALLEAPGSFRSESGKSQAGLHLFLLELCVCVWALLQGLGAQPVLRTFFPLLLHEGLMAFALSARLIHHGLRHPLASACLLLFSGAGPAGIGMGLALSGMIPSPQLQLLRCTIEGLTAGVFIHVSITGLLSQDSAAPKLRIHKVAFLLTGFALVTAVLFSKV
ncbi:zinc transporter ZIP3 [Pseudorasbora parva]|uniref:zinc transporter ZIP3 n=1 Tax=Pseudorasbora parva TaxID=51549 RepID=UPI00351DAB1E